MRLRTQIADKRGISLVEVLAALAVFVVGILAVVRMFPPGFLVVKQSENVTLANRLAQTELERLKGSAANLPVGILGYDPAGSGSVITAISQDDLDDLPGMPKNPYYSDVNKFRHVYAEATKIPSPITTPTWGGASIYVVNFSPIEWTGTNSVVVRSGPMRRRTVVDTEVERQDAINGQLVRSSSDYAIDYRKGEARIYVRKLPYERAFVITYSYWSEQSGRPQLKSVLGATVRVQPDTCLASIPSEKYASVTNEPGFMYIDNGSDSLHRKFNEINPSDSFDPNNPYQYKVLDNVRGVLGFNPAGFGYDEQTAWGRMALTAYIDYDVLDWHIIREERKLPDPQLLPGAADLTIRLTLRYVKNAGLQNAAPPVRPATIEFDGTTYKGLSSSLPFSILAIDLETGGWYNEESLLSNGNFAMAVNYKDGIIKFDPSLAGRTFRIYYRAEGDWALQVFKAYESYRRSYNFSLSLGSPLDHREWYGTTSAANDGVPYFDDKIYFARYYHGTSVAIDYTYRIASGNAFSPYYTVDGDTYQTDKSIGPNGTCGIDPRARIASLKKCNVNDVQITKISKVYGVSVGARVIWREGGRGFNAGQWRKVDLQTYLMRLQD